VQVASTDAIPRMWAVLAEGGDAEAALGAAVEAAVAGGADPASAPRATAATGAVLGLLPRSLAASPPGPAIGGLPSPRPPVTSAQYGQEHSRAASLASVLAVAFSLVAAMGGVYSLSGPGPRASTVDDQVLAGAPAPSAAAASADTPAPAPTSAAPADPRSAFEDPALRAFAEPYLAAPGVSCRRAEPPVDVAESVVCDLGNGRTGLFNRMLGVDEMRAVRRDFLEGRSAEPGTVRSLRWRYAEDRARVPTGIPADQSDTGEGVRVRFVDPQGYRGSTSTRSPRPAPPTSLWSGPPATTRPTWTRCGTTGRTRSPNDATAPSSWSCSPSRSAAASRGRAAFSGGRSSPRGSPG
jgi:hypothetical protein